MKQRALEKSSKKSGNLFQLPKCGDEFTSGDAEIGTPILNLSALYLIRKRGDPQSPPIYTGLAFSISYSGFSHKREIAMWMLYALNSFSNSVFVDLNRHWPVPQAITFPWPQRTSRKMLNHIISLANCDHPFKRQHGHQEIDIFVKVRSNDSAGP